MKILFLSDLHLGSPLFNHKARILSLLNDSYDTVVLIGDIIDTWEGPVNYIADEHEVLISRLNELNLVVVRGNHDPTFEVLHEIFPNASVLSEYNFEYEDMKIKATHGHEFDDLITKYYWLAKITFPIQWALQRLGLNLKGWLRDLLHSIAAKSQDKQYHDLVNDIEKRAIEAYGERYDAVVMGHTHLPKLVEGDCIYVNSGDWISHSTYVLFEDGKFSLKGEY